MRWKSHRMMFCSYWIAVMQVQQTPTREMALRRLLQLVHTAQKRMGLGHILLRMASS